MSHLPSIGSSNSSDTSAIAKQPLKSTDVSQSTKARDHSITGNPSERGHVAAVAQSTSSTSITRSTNVPNASKNGLLAQNGVAQTARAVNERLTRPAPVPLSKASSQTAGQARQVTQRAREPSSTAQAPSQTRLSSKQASQNPPKPRVRTPSGAGNPTSNAIASAPVTPEQCRTVSGIVSSTASRTLPSTLGPRRAVSTISRPKVQSSTEMRTGTASAQERPPFSTFQQQYTPRSKAQSALLSNDQLPSPSARRMNKGARASSTPLQSHSVVTPQSLTTIRQQAELLQLHLLHSSATPTFTAWHNSAKSKLQSRYTAAVTEYKALRQSELDVQQVANLLALREWSPHPNPNVLQKKLSRLITLLTELYVLTDPEEGPYTLLIDKVQQWVRWVGEVWVARDGSSATKNGEDGYFGPVMPLTPARLSTATSSGPAGPIDTSFPEITTTAPVAPVPSTPTFTHDSQPYLDTSDPSLTTTGLGDALKAELGAISELSAQYVTELAAMQNPAPTPGSATAELLQAATLMARQMQEELTALREIEFEVSIGEQRWVEERMEGIRGWVDGEMARR